VNLSARRLAEPRLVEEVAAALRATGLPPERLAVEVTEGSAKRTLAELKALGVRLVLDEFRGDLERLREFPVDIVKIDRSLIAALAPGGPDAAIVGGIVSMGAAMGFAVVAAGVEHEHQAELLRELGCPYAQGFLFGRPQAPATPSSSSSSAGP
jgi:EAL domain-containing protein (putative c-di-GMP-specific phosphodiesterase class I)